MVLWICVCRRRARVCSSRTHMLAVCPDIHSHSTDFVLANDEMRYEIENVFPHILIRLLARRYGDIFMGEKKPSALGLCVGGAVLIRHICVYDDNILCSLASICFTPAAMFIYMTASYRSFKYAWAFKYETKCLTIKLYMATLSPSENAIKILFKKFKGIIFKNVYKIKWYSFRKR